MTCCASNAPPMIVAGADWICAFEIAACVSTWRLDGWDVTADLRRSESSEAALRLSMADGTLIMRDPAGRRIETSVGATQTQALSAGPYVLDLRLQNIVTGVVMQTARVELVVISPITRP